MEKLNELKRQLCDMGVQLLNTGLTYGTCGNISTRIPQQKKIIITPSGIPYHLVNPKDLVIASFDNKIQGKQKPSLETPLHLAVYKKREDLGAIIHTHSCYALAVSAVKTGIPVFIDEIFFNFSLYVGKSQMVAEAVEMTAVFQQAVTLLDEKLEIEIFLQNLLLLGINNRAVTLVIFVWWIG